MTTHDELRVPPHSMPAEQAVLGAVLLDNRAFETLEALRSDDFYRAEHRWIFEVAAKLITQGRPADIVTVNEALQTAGRKDFGGLVYLNELVTNTPGVSNTARYAETVREKALQRAIIQAALDVQDAAWGPTGSAAALDAAQTLFGALADKRVKQEPVALSAALTAYVDDLDARVTGSKPQLAISTGLADLDKILGGGLYPGKLYINAGRPSMGKSALAGTISANFAEAGHPVLFLSMEMPTSEVAERYIGGAGRINTRDLAMAGPAFDEWAKLTYAIQKLCEMPIFIDDQPALALVDVVAKTRAIKRRHGLRLLVVDYLQLMAGPERNRVDQLSTITMGLKRLAMSLDIPVLLLSQLNRDVEKRPDKRPLLSDLRESGSIEQDADVVMMVYRDEVTNPETEWVGLGEIFIRKQRGGPLGEVRLTYMKEFARFENYTGVQVANYADRMKKPARRGFEG